MAIYLFIHLFICLFIYSKYNVSTVSMADEPIPFLQNTKF